MDLASFKHIQHEVVGEEPASVLVVEIQSDEGRRQACVVVCAQMATQPRAEEHVVVASKHGVELSLVCVDPLLKASKLCLGPLAAFVHQGQSEKED